jgi:class 3 adenylate cyclase
MSDSAGSIKARSFSSFLERLIEAADKPLLILAIIAVVLYLVELRGLVSPSGPVRVVSIALDMLFIIDVLLKLIIRRSRYLRSAWLMTDILSCLPGILLLANAPWLQALQFTRLFRVLRVLRGLRVLRSLQFMPSLAHVAAEQDEDGRHFRIGMNVAVSVYAAAFIGVLSWLRGEFVSDPRLLDAAEFFLVIGALLATALFLYLIHNQLRETSWNQLRTLLNIALPRQVAEHFLHHPEAYKERHRAPATVLFIDFVGFSATSEKLRNEVKTLAEHLELVMDAVVERLVEHDLIIDKFIGDAVMAFRGGPLVNGDAADHARRVVRAALEAAGVLADINDPYFAHVKIGCASDDECMIGAFGTSKRLSYTVLGDGVNLAARLEPASGQCGAQALFCDETRRLCGDMPGIAWRRWGTIRVKGKAEPQIVWEAFDTSRIRDISFIRPYEEARGAFERGEIEAARSLFISADAARSGGDKPSRLHSDWCDDLIAKDARGIDTALPVSK